MIIFGECIFTKIVFFSRIRLLCYFSLPLHKIRCSGQSKFDTLPMKKAVFLFFRYYLFWMVFFLFFRGLFLLANLSLSQTLSVEELFGTFRHGCVMDCSAAAYFSLLPGLLIAVSPFFPRIFRPFIKYYTLLLLILVTLLGLADIALYPAWGTRIDAQILPYLKEPDAIFSSITLGQIALALASLAIIVALFFFFFLRFVLNPYSPQQNLSWKAFPVMLLLSALLFLPIRGGVDTAPLNFSSVFFSKKTFANHSAYNYFWAFMYAMTHNDFDKNPVNYMDKEEARRIISPISLFSDEPTPLFIDAHGQKINVILVILESFSNKVIEPLGGRKGLTPNINRLCNEGICFTDFYATGSRSDRGLSSLLAAYPALIKASSILGFPEKMKNITFLPSYFGKHGYDLSFYYGGDINFYNTNMMLIQSGVNNIISRKDFPFDQASRQKWGAPDEFLYARCADELLRKKQPFFSVVYNISSHEPFDVPEHFKRITGTSSSDRYCNSVAYTDSCLGVFIDRLKASPIWNNTLVIITSDHTSLEPAPVSDIEAPESYLIPMVWVGGVVKKPWRCHNICMQTDLSATLFQQLGWDFPKSPFSKNMFGSHHYAFYFRAEGWGYFSPSLGFYQNIDNGSQRFFYGDDSPDREAQTLFAKAFTQFLHDDFISK